VVTPLLTLIYLIFLEGMPILALSFHLLKIFGSH